MDRLISGQTTCNSVEKQSNGDSNLDYSVSDAVRDKLRLMRDRIESEDPASKVTDDATLLRFFYARESNVEKACEMFAKYRKWRQTYVPLGYIPETMVGNELKHKFVYMQGCDKVGRPIMVLLLARHIACQSNMEDFKRFVVYAFDKMSASATKGQTKFSIIADFADWAYKNVNLRGTIAAVQTLQDFYPERLGKVYLINRPYIFWAAWKIVSPFIDKVTRQKPTPCLLAILSLMAKEQHKEQAAKEQQDEKQANE